MRVRTRVEEELLREEGLVLRALLLPVLGTPSSGPRSWRWGGLQVRGRGREVREVEGRKGVLPIALGLTEDGVRTVLDVILTGEEDVVSY